MTRRNYHGTFYESTLASTNWRYVLYQLYFIFQAPNRSFFLFSHCTPHSSFCS